MYEILGIHMGNIASLEIVQIIKAELHEFIENFKKENFTF